MPDYYALLAVPRTASDADLKTAYRRRSRELHPDRNESASANREMARLNEAYAVLSRPESRAEYDRELAPERRNPAAGTRPARRSAPSPAEFVRPPSSGTGSLQPERLPDWYGFLGLKPFADPAQVIAALKRLGDEVRRARYAPEDMVRLAVQIRQAADTLTNPRTRAIYDDAIDGTPPAPGTCAHLHRDYYSFLGVRPSASLDRIAERVTELSGKAKKNSPEFREVEAAWKTLRDPALRAAYDASRGDS